MRVLVFIFAIFVLSGCRAKKKVTERQKAVTEISEQKIEKKKKDSFAIEQIQRIEVTKNQEVQIETEKDSVQVTREGNTISVIGAKKITIRDSQTTEAVKENREVKVETKEKTNEQTDTRTKETSRTSDSNATGMSTGLAVGIGLAFLLAILIVIYYFYRQGRNSLF